jgi:hypothetical protein
MSGDYVMNIELNVDRLFEELDYSNNAFNITFTVLSLFLASSQVIKLTQCLSLSLALLVCAG